MDCPLCCPNNDDIVWQDTLCRVIRVPDPAYPGFCRVVWHAHVAEMTDLAPADRTHLLTVVMAVEAALRQLMKPDKINLASFGNMVPHLHWHVIPRHTDDPHFPESVWGPVQRTGAVRVAPDNSVLASAIDSHLAAHATALTQQPR